MDLRSRENPRVDSPLVRRLRLAKELTALREQRKLSQEALAKACGGPKFSRFRVQRLENAESRPNLNDVLQILEALGVEEDSEQWRTLHRVARDAARTGWWDETTFRRMGDRQRTWANLELGASLIEVYDAFLVPGLLQIEAYYRELSAVETVPGSDDAFDSEVGVAGRMERQRQFNEGYGRLVVVLEEIAVRHLFVSRATMRAQLEHLAGVADSERIQVRIIPLGAEVNARPPRAPFTLFRYPDPADPDIVLLEGIEDDTTHTGERAEQYAGLFDKLAAAARPSDKSAGYLADVAGQIE
jgi:transcriptional regulator with XRE-family HTH domain